jgi:hypothetical protein
MHCLFHGVTGRGARAKPTAVVEAGFRRRERSGIWTTREPSAEGGATEPGLGATRSAVALLYSTRMEAMTGALVGDGNLARVWKVLIAEIYGRKEVPVTRPSP